MNSPIDAKYKAYARAMEGQLHAICQWWMQHMPDEAKGGFLGAINQKGQAVLQAPKGSVLNARILYTFSAAYAATNRAEYLATAERAYGEVLHRFIDPDYGGVYWTLDAEGKPLDTKKQVYASAFALYGLATYHSATADAPALQAAIQLYEALEQKAFDTVHGGYVDAFDRKWQPMEDIRLSEKDENAAKTMNTHLHVLEAYTALYRVWPRPQLAQQLVHLLDVFFRYFIDPESRHLRLFFNHQWQGKQHLISYGHDVEAAWLLHEAAEVLCDASWIQRTSENALLMAAAAARGLDKDGGLWYEMDTRTGTMIREKHWWPQAEAMIGFWQAGTLSGDEKWFTLSMRCWNFVQENLLDRQYGEWHWGITANGHPMTGQDKAGLWKCPYHNGRACIELMHRIGI